MSAPNDNPIIDVLERGCADLIAGRRTPAAAAIEDKFPLIARSGTLRQRIRDRAAPRTKHIRDFTPQRAALPRSTRANFHSAATQALLPRFRFEFDELICRDETNPEPFGHDTMYALWGTIPVAPNAQATSGKVGRYGGMDDGDRRRVDRVMYEGPALGMSYSIVLFEEDHGDWIAAYDEFAQNVARFWNEDVLPLVDDVEEALGRVDEIPVVGEGLGALADGASDFLRQLVGFVEKIAGWIDTAIRAIFDFLGFQDDPFPEISQSMDLPALLDIPVGQSRIQSHTRSAHGGRYEVKVEITHLPYPTSTPGNTSTRRPCLLGTDARLLMLWSGSSSRRELNLRTAGDYRNFGSKKVQPVEGLRSEPSAAEWKGKTVVAWVER
ncbi:MAG: hypothetical protein KDK70_42770, partial [Myxococcales bacterium]|nr:hypothetical protein [Myxococcales bacterium]